MALNASPNEYDVAVIGAGPAGAGLACLLARRGHSVVVFERAPFPRPHVGESLLGMSVPLLRLLGVEKQISERFLRKDATLFAWGQDRDPRVLLLPPTGYSYHVDRPVFDAMLLDHARTEGARIVQPGKVLEVLMDEDRACGLVYCNAEGKQQRIITSYIVDASGASAIVRRQLGISVIKSGHPRCARYVQIGVPDDAPDAWLTATVTEAVDSGWLWWIPLSRSRASVGLVGRPDLLSNTPAIDLVNAINQSRLTKERVGRQASLDGTQTLAYSNLLATRLCGPGYFLVGDAAGFVDPLLSTGVHGALYSANLAAASIHALLTKTIEPSEVMNTYHYRIQKHLKRVGSLVQILYSAGARDTQFWIEERQLFANLTEDWGNTLGRQSALLLAGALDHLEFSQPVRRVIEWYATPSARGVSIDQTTTIMLAFDAELLTGPVIVKDEMVLGASLFHKKNRSGPLEFPFDSLGYRLVFRLKTGPITLRELCDEATTWNDGQWFEEASSLVPKILHMGISLDLISAIN